MLETILMGMLYGAQVMKQLIKNLHAINPEIEMNIFKSVEKVDLSSLIGWHDGSGAYLS